jgi:hypothetical protein
MRPTDPHTRRRDVVTTQQTPETRRYFYARNFAVAIWLDGRGFRPLSAEMARDGSGVIFLFDRAGIDEVIGEFYEAKTRLNDLSTGARTR